MLECLFTNHASTAGLFMRIDRNELGQYSDFDMIKAGNKNLIDIIFFKIGNLKKNNTKYFLTTF